MPVSHWIVVTSPHDFGGLTQVPSVTPRFLWAGGPGAAQLALCSGVPGCGHSATRTERGPTSQLYGCQPVTEGPPWLAARRWPLSGPGGPCSSLSPHTATYSIEPPPSAKAESYVMSHNHDRDVPSPLPYSINEKSVTGPVHTRGEDGTQGCEPRRWRTGVT